MFKEVQLVKITGATSPFYDMGISYDHVYQINDVSGIPLGLIYVSEMLDGSIYIEWVELLTVFQGKGYLRAIFKELEKEFVVAKITLQCTEKLVKKYESIGCKIVGRDVFTENTTMVYTTAKGRAKENL